MHCNNLLDNSIPSSERINNALNDKSTPLRVKQYFALYCAESVKHLMTDKQSIDALRVTRRYLDGKASEAELKQAQDAAYAAAYNAATSAANSAAYNAANAAYAAYNAAAYNAAYAANAAYNAAYAATSAAATSAAYSAAYAANADANREVVYKCVRDSQLGKLVEMIYDNSL